MRYKKLFFSLLFLILGISLYILFLQDKGEIHIKTGNYPIQDVMIIYETTKVRDKIGNLSAHSSYVYPIQYSDTEMPVFIEYLDKDGKRHTNLIEPYAAKYNKQNYHFVTP